MLAWGGYCLSKYLLCLPVQQYRGYIILSPSNVGHLEFQKAFLKLHWSHFSFSFTPMLRLFSPMWQPASLVGRTGRRACCMTVWSLDSVEMLIAVLCQRNCVFSQCWLTAQARGMVLLICSSIKCKETGLWHASSAISSWVCWAGGWRGGGCSVSWKKAWWFQTNYSVSFSHLAFITKPSILNDSVDAHPGYWLDKTMQNV